ncbi:MULTISPECIES: hypothetical protein [unclassified Serratia (in: enterobacteria)]|uniref:hypothetical protein n=1 Tax=unclassified Serratia (in: enterobacteria) TaxID=2647522 RepID=UPI003B42F6B1
MEIKHEHIRAALLAWSLQPGGRKGLSTGNSAGLRILRDNIRDPALRQQILSTAMGHAWSIGSRTEHVFNPAAYYKWYKGLQETGTLQLLQKEFSPEVNKQMNNMYKIAQRKADVRDKFIYTGKAQSINDQFGKPNGAHRKLTGDAAGTFASAMVAHVPVVGPFFAGPVYKFISKAATGKTGAERAIAAGDFMAGPLRQYMEEARTVPAKNAETFERIAEKRLANSASWKRLYEHLDSGERKTIARVGILGWLSGDDKSDQ